MGLNIANINCNIDKVVCHEIGNKWIGDGVIMSSKPITMDDHTRSLFYNYLLGEFARNECLYNLYNAVDLSLNKVYQAVSKIFDDPSTFINYSQDIGRHLYDQSTHPKISNGYLLIVYLKDCNLNGVTLDAVGIFKSESKHWGLSIIRGSDAFDINSDLFIDVNKLDRGCIIYNAGKELGYVANIVNTTKRVTADYWYNDFLSVREHRDNSYYTRNIIRTTLCYIQTSLDADYKITDLDKVELLSSVTDYFNQSDTFDFAEFCAIVFGSIDNGGHFKRYVDKCWGEMGIDIPESFVICTKEYRRNQSKLRHKIKIDKNIEISLKCISNKIEVGVDLDYGQFYKIYISQ